MNTDLVTQLRLVRPKAKYEYAKDQFLMIGVVMREAADEIERLRAGIDEHRRTVCNDPKAAGRGADEKLWALVPDDAEAPPACDTKCFEWPRCECGRRATSTR